MLKTNLDLRHEPFPQELLTPFDLQTKQVNGKRFYDVSGELFPSVTTVLSSLNKQDIYEWRRRVGEEEANRISGQASRRGTKMHKMCEDYLLNKEGFAVDHMPSTINLFNQIRPWIDSNIEAVYGNEIPLFSKKLKSAGRCDIIAKVNGEPAVVDFKTSSKLKNAEWIENYFLQVTAYSIMLHEMYGMVAKKAYILIAVENEPNHQLFPIDIKDYYHRTLQVFRQYHTDNS